MESELQYTTYELYHTMNSLYALQCSLWSYFQTNEPNAFVSPAPQSIRLKIRESPGVFHSIALQNVCLFFAMLHTIDTYYKDWVILNKFKNLYVTHSRMVQFASISFSKQLATVGMWNKACKAALNQQLYRLFMRPLPILNC